MVSLTGQYGKTFGAGGRSERYPILTDRKSTRLNSSHRCISYAVFCLKKKISGISGFGIASTGPVRQARWTFDHVVPQPPLAASTAAKRRQARVAPSARVEPRKRHGLRSARSGKLVRAPW